MKRITAKLKKELGREPTRDEIAVRMGLSREDVEDMELIEEKNVSLSDKYYNDEIEVGDRIKDTLSPSVEYQIIKNSIQDQIVVPCSNNVRLLSS